MTYVSGPLRARVMSATALTLMPWVLLCLGPHFSRWFYLRPQATSKTVRWPLNSWYLMHNHDTTLRTPGVGCGVESSKYSWVTLMASLLPASVSRNLFSGNNNEVVLFPSTCGCDPLNFRHLICLLWLHCTKPPHINDQLRCLWLDVISSVDIVNRTSQYKLAIIYMTSS